MKEWVSKMKNILQDVTNYSGKSTKLTSNAQSDTYLGKSNQVTKPETSEPETIGNTPQCTTLDCSIESSKFVTSKKYIQNKPIEYEVDEVMRSDKKPFHISDDDKLSYQIITDKKGKTLKELHKHFESQSVHELRKWKTDSHPLFDHNYPSPKSNQEYRAKYDIPIRLIEKNEIHMEPKTKFEFSDSKYHKELIISDNKVYIKNQSSIQESESLISRETFKDISEFYSEQNEQRCLEPNNRKDSSRQGIKEKIKSQSILQNKIHYSKEALDKKFTYCFPTKTNIKETKLAKTPTELILDTQNMLITRAEKEKVNNNEKSQQRLHEKTVNKSAREKEKRMLQKKAAKQKIYENEVRNAEPKTTGQDKIKQGTNKTVKAFTYKSNYKDNTNLHKIIEEREHNKNREALKVDAERKDIIIIKKRED